MNNTPEYPYNVSDITPYEEKHYYENQKVFDNGIPINPVLRIDFDSTSNECRDLKEKRDWWDRAFIVTDNWDGISDTWIDYKARSEWLGFKPKSEEAFTQRLEKQKRTWLDSWPSDTRYSVRRLDGGAWDRSTLLAMLPSLEEAVSLAIECDGVIDSRMM